MLTLNDGRSELWQWDTGRNLNVDADCTQVHFSNKVFGRSVDVDVVDGVASIPDILLQTEKDLTVWAFVGTPENGYTKFSKTFKVNKRNKPADYVFTPPEQTTLGEILERLDDIRVEETDPTVPAWAKQPTKPRYTVSEVVATVNGIEPDEDGNVEFEVETATPDWNAAEGEPGHIKNRTHWDDFEEITFAEDKTVNKTGFSTVSWLTYDKVKDCTTARVIFNGVEYVCPVTVRIDFTEYGDESYFYIGTFQDGAPQYPFCFWGYIGKYFAIVNAEDGTHTVSIYGRKEVVHKLPEKYLPDYIKTVNGIAPDEKGNVELDEGFSPIATVEQTDDGAVISITDKDGTTTATITNGQRGRSILHITTKPSVNTTAVGDITPPYRVGRAQVINQAGVGKDDILYGDIIESGSTHYKVLTVFSNYVYLDNPVSIKGVDGTNGKSAYEYAQEAGYTGTETQFAKKLASDNGVSSWNALSDKPFYEMDTLFDGNTSGHEVAMFSESLSFVKMNDHVFTEEECIGKVASVYIEASDTVAEMSVSANGIMDLAGMDLGISGFLVFPDELMTYEIPAVMIVKEPIFTDYISLSAGTYYAIVNSDSIGKGHTTYFSAFDDVVTLKKLDEKYLPDMTDWVNALIDEKLGVIENGSY